MTYPLAMRNATRILMTCLTTCMLVAFVQAQPVDLGETDFPTSGAPEAQESFLQGLLLLHSFEYEDAREAFQEAQQKDPNFAMAYWGEAMTHNHPLWAQQDREAAREALNRLAATPEARLAKAPTEREKAYLRAVHVLYGDGSKQERDRAYAEAMREVAEQHPDDLDAAAFHALAVLGTSHSGRDFSIYMRAAAILEQVFDENPKHPGAAHYLIHSYDDPIHAPLGLRPARVYAEIAPAAAHALHMPSHIFVALGMWDKVVASNEDSWAASEARVQRKGLSSEQRGYHALWWLAYGYLQQGRYDKAQEMLDIVHEDAKDSGSSRARSHLVRMRAAHLIDTERWTGAAADFEVDLSGLGHVTVATDLLIRGIAALEAGDRAAAEQRLADLKTYAEEADGADEVNVMAHELAALLHLDAGQQEQAVQRMEEATAIEDGMSFNFGPPSPVKPSHELLGEIMLDLDRPAEAQAQFSKALERAPRRARALLGLARAASAAGDTETAQEAYSELRTIWDDADPGLDALEEVKLSLR